jgi:hypothetical protein
LVIGASPTTSICGGRGRVIVAAELERVREEGEGTRRCGGGRGNR